jgi:hypothetical protein
MLITLDETPLDATLPDATTLADALFFAQNRLPASRIITKIQLDGTDLEGASLAEARPRSLAGHTLTLVSADRHEMSLGMIGRLAALIEWLAPQHKQVAALLEKGDQAAAFQGLGRIFSTWQTIQAGYGNLAKINSLTLSLLPVRSLHAEALMNEFVGHLGEMQTALQNRDLVMLADILQYEMDGAVANWMSLLEATLAVVQGETAAAA